jgi:hypothetical protein
MRGFLQPSHKATQTDNQKRFATLSRHRRTKLAHAAKTTLVKADQWARGDAVAADVAGALESALAALGKKKKH